MNGCRIIRAPLFDLHHRLPRHGTILHETVASIPMLVYHRFCATAADSMTVRTERFEEQLRFFALLRKTYLLY